MAATSEKFEQQIERIHRLLENEGAVITWNDKIPDPDNPSQPRQIDIPIRRDDKITLVECRIHKETQGVKWIEELIGRRQSLRADAVIAVSASGFTAGAIAKAEKFGVILRSLESLSEEEIKAWGKATKVEIVYYQFTDCLMTFKIPPDSPFPGRLKMTNLDGTPMHLRGMFEQIMRLLDDDKRLDHASGTITVPILNEMLLDGLRPLECTFSARIRKIFHKATIASVVTYAAPKDRDVPYAHVESIDLETFEILQAGDNVAVVTDLSQIDPPPDSFFHGVNMDFGRIVTSKGFKFIGLKEATLSRASISFRVESSSR